MALLSPSRRVIPSPSAGIWPDLEIPPRGAIHAKIAELVLRGAMKKMPLQLTFPDGTTWGTTGPRLQVVRPQAFFHRLGRSGLIGFGEAWMTGDLTADDWHPGRVGGSIKPGSSELANTATDTLVEALTVLARRMDTLVPMPLQRLRRLWESHKPTEEENDPTGARDNIHRHYDLSNDLFERFLDPTMSYSAAWYDSGSQATDDLEAAQYRKIDGILDQAGVRQGSRLLEIGSGWGALAIRAAAERGASVVTLTLSAEQKSLAEERIAAAGLSDRIEVRLEDYREHAAAHAGEYDSVVSVEMIEAVGERYWPDYFAAVDQLLAPGGKFGLQAITIPHERLLVTRRSWTWIHKYIFPGGILPSLAAIDKASAGTTLRVNESRRLGPSYATTLRQWRYRFNGNLDEISALGFDETFARMWNFYLAYCEAGFRSEYIDDWQLGLSRT